MELPSRAQTNPKRGLYNDGRKHLHIYNDRPEEIGSRIKRDRDGQLSRWHHDSARSMANRESGG